MRSIALELPDEAAAFDFEVRMYVAVALYDNHTLSLGQSAALEGLTKTAFILRSAAFGGLKLRPQTVQELAADVPAIEQDDRHHSGRYSGLISTVQP